MYDSVLLVIWIANTVLFVSRGSEVALIEEIRRN